MKFFKQTGASTLVYAVSAIGIASAAVFAVNSLESSIDNTLSDVNTQIASVNATIADGVTVTPATIPIHHYAFYQEHYFTTPTHWTSESFVLSEFESAFTSSSNVIIFPTFDTPLSNETWHCSDRFSDVSTHQLFLTADYTYGVKSSGGGSAVIKLANDNITESEEYLTLYNLADGVSYSYVNANGTFSEYIPDEGIVCVLSGSTSAALNNIQAFTDFSTQEQEAMNSLLATASSKDIEINNKLDQLNLPVQYSYYISEGSTAYSNAGMYTPSLKTSPTYLNLQMLQAYAAAPHSSEFSNTDGNNYASLYDQISNYITADVDPDIDTYLANINSIGDALNTAEDMNCKITMDAVNVVSAATYTNNNAVSNEDCTYFRDAVQENYSFDRIHIVHGSTCAEDNKENDMYHTISLINFEYMPDNSRLEMDKGDWAAIYGGNSHLSIYKSGSNTIQVRFEYVHDNNNTEMYFNNVGNDLANTSVTGISGAGIWMVDLDITTTTKFCLYWQNYTGGYYTSY